MGRLWLPRNGSHHQTHVFSAETSTEQKYGGGVNEAYMDSEGPSLLIPVWIWTSGRISIF